MRPLSSVVVGVVAEGERVGVGGLCEVDDGGGAAVDDGGLSATGGEEITKR